MKRHYIRCGSQIIPDLDKLSFSRAKIYGRWSVLIEMSPDLSSVIILVRLLSSAL